MLLITGHLKKINTGLLVAILIINGYIIVLPIVPQVSFWWQEHHGTKQATLKQVLAGTTTTGQSMLPDQANSVIAPTMLLQQPIIEGPISDSFNLLNRGVWHWPDSSTPDKGGNTVLLAHRFSYTGPHGAFYFLDKLQVGDEVGLTWHGLPYRYRVVSSRQVTPDQTAITANTSDARLTLYTCTPLWHPVNRLVVVAERMTDS